MGRLVGDGSKAMGSEKLTSSNQGVLDWWQIYSTSRR